MKITIEGTQGEKKRVIVIEQLGEDESLDDVLELFEDALRGYGYSVGTLTNESKV